ncbi:hypothetical protein [Microbacterium sp. 22242]|uniref:hypothetical protein n=1 Tax=Microbacterium sp. 22242 TaxID=3453896 RepID=UPI003F878EED
MRRRDTFVAGMMAALSVAGLGIATVPEAGADPATQVVQGQYVRLVLHADHSSPAEMEPGTDVRWDLVVSDAAPGPGTVLLGVSATGDAPIEVDARLCSVAWQGEKCAGGSQLLRSAWSVPRDGRTVVLDAMPAGSVAHLRLDVRLAGGEVSGATQLRVHADGFGDHLQTGPEESLAPTGGSAPISAIVGGGVLLLAAAALLLVPRRRRGGDS